MPTIAETIRKINEFAELPNGWHFGEGVPPSQDARRRAISFVSAANALGIKRANAFPGASGQVQVTFYHDDRMLELTLEEGGAVTIAEDEGSRQIEFKEGASQADAYASLWKFGQTLWDSLESSIVSTMIQSVTTSLVRLLTSPATNLSPLSIENVLLKRAVESANTFRHSIASRPANPLSFGIYRMNLSRMGASSGSREVPLETIATIISTVGLGDKPEKRLSH
jgi:hypothetical protein